MSKFSVAYIPVGVPTFHLESAQKEFENSISLLKTLTDTVYYPREALLSVEKLNEFLDEISPDLIIFQSLTFANSRYISSVLNKFTCPIALWALREPVIDGMRLRLNSLTGAYSAANVIKQCRGEPVEFVFGSPKEDDTARDLKVIIDAARVKKALTELNIACVGHTPDGFGFGRALDVDVLKTFGCNLLSVESRELMNRARSYTDDEILPFLEDAEKKTVGLEKIPKKNRMDFARLYKAYSDFCGENKIGALSSRCWPDFFTDFGTPVCTVLAMMNDSGVPSSCETDTYGALSMYIGSQFSKLPCFFGDPVSLDEKENAITFWHCGTAACSLARESRAEIGVHCNRKIGPTLEFGCKAAERVTIFRIGRSPDGNFRAFICVGKALDKPKQFSGVSVVVETENDARSIVVSSVKAGFEPHFAVCYGDISARLKSLCGMLGIEICEY